MPAFLHLAIFTFSRNLRVLSFSSVTSPRLTHMYLSSPMAITKTVHALWWTKSRVCMRVCKHGFAFWCANHASTNLKKFWLDIWQVFLIYPFPHQLKPGKSLQNMLCQFVLAKADILSEKNPYFGKPLFSKTLWQVRISLSFSAIIKNFAFFHWKVNL